MLLRAKLSFLSVCVTWLAACGGEPPAAPTTSSESPVQTPAEAAMTAEATGGRRERPPPTACEPQELMEVRCGEERCPTSTQHENDPCFLPCCVQHEGKERCGFRGTSRAFTTECVLPAVSDPSCDEVPQFEGCCEQTRHVCGVIGGFAPGCQTQSPFLTFPDPLKPCGPAARDQDAGP